ncbi:hypothetical protein PPYR_12932 [Photinus pyralis]|uniref:CHK kinase-like domain-containing protein n=2 Tax=Photinus pyralis TaxID=7054 RepID=A0A5N4A7M6_PHOPY|nr:uncharacterized protein LOC116178784 isoform X1 [Photinus pyralis]KAB0793312.1 hypothetical protein PPYR_12932 [Photinus pyralis]
MSATTDNQLTIKEKLLPLVKQFLKDALEGCTVEMSCATKPGQNWLGLVQNLKVQGDGKAEINLVAKLAPYQRAYRNMLPIRNIYEREVFFYEKVVPEFLKLQEKKALSSGLGPFIKVHLTSLEMFREALIMENMKLKGFRDRDYRIDVDYAHASLVMKEMGKLHALSFAIKDQTPDVYRYIEENLRESFFNSNSFNRMVSMVQISVEVISKDYESTHDRALCLKLRTSFEKVPDFLKSLQNSRIFGRYSAITHGDLQIRNVMFKYENPSQVDVPTEVCIIDWQTACIGSIAFDIAYFMFLCTSGSFRKLHYTNLLRDYYQSLTSLLIGLGSDPEALIPYSAVLSELRQFAKLALYKMVWIASLNMIKAQDIPDIFNLDEEQIEKHLSSVPNEAYVKKIRDIISDFVEYGYDF